VTVQAITAPSPLGQAGVWSLVRSLKRTADHPYQTLANACIASSRVAA
jgi:hypothetical protein